MLFDLTDDNADDYGYLDITDVSREPTGNRSSKRGTTSSTKRDKKKGDQPPKTFDEFYDWLLKASSRKKLSVSADNAGVPDDRLIDILPVCVVCSSKKADVRMILRSCLKSYYPCTGHSCKCVSDEEEGNNDCECDDDDDDCGKKKKKDDLEEKSQSNAEKHPLKVRFYPCCSKCLAHVLWESSNDYMRSQKRYRGKCPFCKAAFCANDLLLIDGVE